MEGGGKEVKGIQWRVKLLQEHYTPLWNYHNDTPCTTNVCQYKKVLKLVLQNQSKTYAPNCVLCLTTWIKVFK
jgi:hypothetical protein